MTKEQCEAKAASGPYCFLYREALDSDLIDWSFPTTRTGTWTVRACANDESRTHAYLTESLATALEHEDRVLATRAAFQAIGYLERCKAKGWWVGGPAYHDAARAAIERVAGWVQSGIDTGHELQDLQERKVF